jgi:hypothetical protein
MDELNAQRMAILERVERGEISVVDGMRLLEALPGAETPTPQSEIIDAPRAADAMPPDAAIEKWKRWWVVPFAVGIVITIITALLMMSAIQASGYGFWFFCLWVPFTLGVTVLTLAWASRTARWLHVRVNTGKDEWPRRIALSFPLPVRLTAWALRTFGWRIPGLRNTGVDELVLALNDTTSSRQPLYVEVNDGDDGEKVQVYIG